MSLRLRLLLILAPLFVAGLTAAGAGTYVAQLIVKAVCEPGSKEFR